jgi:hypothetical protein
MGCKYVFQMKHKSHEFVEKYKAQLLAKGYSHIEGMIIMRSP